MAAAAAAAAEARYSRFQALQQGSSSTILRPVAAASLPLQLWKRESFKESRLSAWRSSSSSTASTSQMDEDEEEDAEESMLLALRSRRTDEAWRLLQKVKKSKQGMPGRECVSRLIAQLCLQGASSSVRKAQELVAELEGSGEIQQLVDCDAMGLLVMACSRTGAARYSLRMLRTMIHEWGMRPSVKVWSAVVARLSRSDEDAKLALEVFDEICSVLPIPREEEFSAMYPDCGAFNAALNACAGCGEFDRAGPLWQSDMPRFNVAPDVLSFNVLIKLHARARKLHLVEAVLREMESSGVEPNLATFNSLVAAFVGAGEMDRAVRVLCTLKNDEEYSRVLEKLGRKTEERDDPFIVLLEKHRGRFAPDVRMLTTLMKGYVQQGRASEALQLLVAMQESEPSSSAAAPNEFTFTMAMRACTKMGLMKEARAILGEMARIGIAANAVTYNTLLQGLCSIPDMKAACRALEDMKAAGVAPDVVSFNTIIAGHLRAGDASAAMDTFSRMRREAGIPPSRVTYGILMSAFARAGHPDFAARVFAEMGSDSRVRVDLVACNILIDAYARAGMEAQASGAFADLKSMGFLPSNATYTILVKAYARSSNYGELLLLWKEIMQRSSSRPLSSRFRPDEALLDSLIDAFVRGAYFSKALQVVECMEVHGIEANRARAKYKRLYVELYANLFTSPYRSQSRRSRTVVRRRAVEAFKFWLGLPNTLYAGDWRLRNADDDDEE